MNKAVLKKLIQIIIFVIIATAVYFIPISGLNEAGRRTLSILIFAALLWITEIIPVYVTSFVILFLQAILLTRPMDVNFRVFLAPFFDSVIVLFLGGLILAQALKKYELDEWFVFLILKKIGNTPRKILLGFMAVTAFLSMWMSNTATTALMIGLVLVLAENIPKDDPLLYALTLGIPFSANIGGIATPIGTPPNALTISILKNKGINISFIGWMAFALPLTILLFLLIYWILSSSFKSNLKVVPVVKPKEFIFDIQQKVILWVFLITLALWLTSELHKIPTSIVSLIPVIVFHSIGLLNEEDFGAFGWDTLMLMGGGLSLGMSIEKSGLSSWFVNAVRLQSFPNILLLIGLAIITILLTTFISNTSAAAILLPIAVGISPKFIDTALLVGISASIAMILPISTPPNAIAYGAGIIKLRDMVKFGSIIAIGSAIIIVIFIKILTLIIS
ncbi:MAG: DASS family sodium-coupled anion symporter [candidate division WOR-3 bacterium]|nr:DASS family sodium-coupled anion symporter [candidate division WOR-3 bacterium]MCX7757425.1 DASS family sodium-coupled anion symporter [candidate division WOR-3 bacterium]MDW7987781.1 DASS family sodium-coupled anion symporter [candidate division WOR-3 bacterium]